MFAASRDELFDSQEVDDEENNIPGAGNSNEINIQEVNDDERDNEAGVDEEAEQKYEKLVFVAIFCCCQYPNLNTTLRQL